MPTSAFLERTFRRRTFLRVAGATAASTALVLAGCNSDDNNPTPSTEVSLVLDGNDNGLLNLAYLLEQLEATFYQKVVDAFPSDFTAEDKAAFIDLRDHEVIHREYLKYVLGSNAYDQKTGNLTFTLTSFTFTTRAGVYAAARTLEDIGVGAYNGAAKLLSEPAYLVALSKLASVEARHAAFVREQAQAGSFASSDVVGSTGLDTVKTPAEVAALLAPYLPLKLVVDKLTALS
ncbi:ferritin-like domain-containing protein [Hymenobacter pini]|uniref:ferritin-like domain-containing protein n=1 Tax=Hymenobacter pini TaxID=2880879 RepID=UPI001CF44A1C|nr:ferritin-like domain-containing protein [Hymenobacter pini]MCA8831584.1 ferritin-like domain-containing protein [Hymenobacter pini]